MKNLRYVMCWYFLLHAKLSITLTWLDHMRTHCTNSANLYNRIYILLS